VIRLSVLLILTLISAALSLHAGSAHLNWSEISHYLAGQNLNEQSSFIFAHLRLPRTEAALVIGASLGAAGLVLQTLLRNPLAEPYTLGLSGGSSLGAVTALYLSLEPSTLWIPLLSSAGCFFAVILVFGLAHRKVVHESQSLILFGVMISLFFGALVVAGLSILSPEKLQTALFWLLGEFGTSRDQWIFHLGPALIFCLVILFLKTNALDALALGEARAVALGFSPKAETRILIFICTILTSLSVSIAGLVGFIGLVSPHLARRFLKTSNHRYLLIGSILIGAGLLTVADSLARTLAGTGEVPAGSIAALIGAPVLIFLLMRKNYASAE
jgi:iron complex transport system permease protein